MKDNDLLTDYKIKDAWKNTKQKYQMKLVFFSCMNKTENNSVEYV